MFKYETRFVTARELAQLLGTTCHGDGETVITGAAPVETADAGQLAFVANNRFAEQGLASRAGCLMVPPDFEAGGRCVIRDVAPRRLFARALGILYPDLTPAGVHPSAVIGEGSTIGDGTSIGAGCVIGHHVRIGAGGRIYPNVTIYDRVTIGHRVILHSGCVIGADGFGFALDENRRYVKFPQVGEVRIGDDVEIGANSCVDRAALGVTRIGDGTKLDNLVHIGHNCDIGKNVVIAAQTGLSGAVIVGDSAVIGGQVGIGDKARIESGAVLGSGCGVLPLKIVRAGEPVWGTPARPLKKYLTQLATLARIARK
jgi:UDP-3-O-[3-hydroxymyristoyl] glucosamine N-acyltransferase